MGASKGDDQQSRKEDNLGDCFQTSWIRRKGYAIGEVQLIRSLIVALFCIYSCRGGQGQLCWHTTIVWQPYCSLSVPDKDECTFPWEMSSALLL